MMFALMFVFVVAIVGGAIDMNRWRTAHSKMQHTMDAAVLAAGKTLLIAGENKAVAAGQEYYSQNKYEHTTADTAQFVIENGNTIQGTLNAQIETAFLKVIGISELPVNIETGVALSGAVDGKSGNLEIALMLDVTGSMCDGNAAVCSSSTKLDAMREAAADLVKVVVWEDQGTYRSRVAVIPFAGRIRIAKDGEGGTLMKQMTNLDPNWSGWMRICVDGSSSSNNGAEGTTVWSCDRYENQYVSNWQIRPCVSDRNGADEATDAAPGSGRWLNAYAGNRQPIGIDSGDTTPASGTGTSQDDPLGTWNYTSDGKCNDSAEENAMLPLTSDKDILLDKISGLRAQGSTAGALGAAFSFYALSPEWSNVWPTESRPDSYSDINETTSEGAQKLRKVAILMSDGVYNTWRTNNGEDQQTVSDRAKAICENMKQKGIEIFAIGFDLDSLPASERTIAEDTLKSCGSSIEHFYNSLDTNQLKGAFRSIAMQLATIRITN